MQLNVWPIRNIRFKRSMRADVRGRGERFWIFTRDVHRRCLQTKRTILEEIEAVITDDNIYEMPEILMSEL